MNALILGGQSPRHKQWVRQAAEALRPHFAEVRFLDYQHWDTERTEIDLESELQRAAETAKDLGDYVIVAKSIGSVLATLGNARGVLHPKRCVFLGFPLKVVRELPQSGKIQAALQKLPPTVFLHNQSDPLGSANQLRDFVAANAPAEYDLQMVPNTDTHDYIDLI